MTGKTGGNVGRKNKIGDPVLFICLAGTVLTTTGTEFEHGIDLRFTQESNRYDIFQAS